MIILSNSEIDRKKKIHMGAQPPDRVSHHVYFIIMIAGSS